MVFKETLTRESSVDVDFDDDEIFNIAVADCHGSSQLIQHSEVMDHSVTASPGIFLSALFAVEILFLAIVKTFGYHTQYAEARGDGEHA